MCKNKLIIAAAGSGKTTLLVNLACKEKNGRVLITTYTTANKEEIKKKFVEINKCVPENVTIQTWFSFLLQHGVRPYQGKVFDKEITGMYLSSRQSGLKYYYHSNPVYFSEKKEFEKYYFTNSYKVYSDKISKFVIRCNEKSNSEVINRLSKIYQHIYIDEVQDLAGYDLEFIKILFTSSSKIILVGDPRQVTYLTHHEKKYTKYKDGHIKEFVINECKKIECKIDDSTLNTSYRNNEMICNFSSKLYPGYKPCSPGQTKTTDHDGVFLIRKKDIKKYLNTYRPMQLRYDKDTKDINQDFPVMNYGLSKGLSFDRVLIYPTKPIEKYIVDGILKIKSKKKNKKMNEELQDAFDIAKFYVAITRARYSVGIVYDYDDSTNIDGTVKYI